MGHVCVDIFKSFIAMLGHFCVAILNDEVCRESDNHRESDCLPLSLKECNLIKIVLNNDKLII